MSRLERRTRPRSCKRLRQAKTEHDLPSYFTRPPQLTHLPHLIPPAPPEHSGGVTKGNRHRRAVTTTTHQEAQSQEEVVRLCPTFPAQRSRRCRLRRYHHQAFRLFRRPPRATWSRRAWRRCRRSKECESCSQIWISMCPRDGRGESSGPGLPTLETTKSTGWSRWATAGSGLSMPGGATARGRGTANRLQAKSTIGREDRLKLECLLIFHIEKQVQSMGGK